MKFLDRFKKKAGRHSPLFTEGRERRVDTVIKADKAAVVETVAKPKNLSLTAVQASQALLHPVVTEKAARAEAMGVYTFVVARQATKDQLRRALQALYGVTPSVIRIANVEGKRVRSGRMRGKRADWKKAMVTLAKGQTIRIHEGV